MSRLLLCLPFFLFFALLYPRLAPEQDNEKSRSQPRALTPPKAEWFVLTASTPQMGFPVAVPWLGIYHATHADPYAIEPLPEKDILVFMDKCLEKYQREVKGYNVVLSKRERIKGTLKPSEIVAASFREEPHSVIMKWRKGAGLAAAVLYVDGENDGHMLVKPAGLLAFAGIVKRKVNGPEASSTSRQTINQFGMKGAMQRVLKAWKSARAENILKVKYEGVYMVHEAGDRPCYKLHRDRSANPDDEGVADVVIYVDKETLLQVGTVLRDIDGNLIARYFFRDIELNPTFADDYFTQRTLSKR